MYKLSTQYHITNTDFQKENLKSFDHDGMTGWGIDDANSNLIKYEANQGSMVSKTVIPIYDATTLIPDEDKFLGVWDLTTKGAKVDVLSKLKKNVTKDPTIKLGVDIVNSCGYEIKETPDFDINPVEIK